MVRLQPRRIDVCLHSFMSDTSPDPARRDLVVHHLRVAPRHQRRGAPPGGGCGGATGDPGRIGRAPCRRRRRPRHLQGPRRAPRARPDHDQPHCQPVARGGPRRPRDRPRRPPQGVAHDHRRRRRDAAPPPARRHPVVRGRDLAVDARRAARPRRRARPLPRRPATTRVRRRRTAPSGSSSPTTSPTTSPTNQEVCA